MNDVLAGREYVAGRFSIADAALFYTEFWADRIVIDLPERGMTTVCALSA